MKGPRTYYGAGGLGIPDHRARHEAEKVLTEVPEMSDEDRMRWGIMFRANQGAAKIIRESVGNVISNAAVVGISFEGSGKSLDSLYDGKPSKRHALRIEFQRAKGYVTDMLRRIKGSYIIS